MNGAADTGIGATAADVGDRLVNIGVSGLRIFGQQGRCRDQESGLAEATLRHLFIHPSLLDFRKSPVRQGQTFDRHDFGPLNVIWKDLAGRSRFTVDQHTTSTALGNTTAIFGAKDAQILTQDPKQRFVGTDVQDDGRSVEGETGHGQVSLSGEVGFGFMRFVYTIPYSILTKPVNLVWDDPYRIVIKADPMKNIDALPLPARILRSAFIAFGELGYEKTSMDVVAEHAKTTKRTVYAHFTNKEALFRASFEQAVEWFLAELPELDPNHAPEEELLRFASRFSDLTTWRGPVRLQRVAISEAERLPDLSQMMHERVIRGAEQRVAVYLSASGLGGKIGGDQALRLARLFLNMTTGPKRFATLFEATKPVPEHPAFSGFGTDEDWVLFAVRFFLDGIAKTLDFDGPHDIA